MDNQWKELSGEKNWEGLLEPLDDEFRKVITRCGESVRAVYGSIDKHGLPEHEEEAFFSKVDPKTDKPILYTVTKYLYATSNVSSKASRICKVKTSWIGYVAVATDEGTEVLGRRDILICWRGTVFPAEWFKNLEFGLISASDILGEAHDLQPKVHKGFLSVYTSANTSESSSSARDQVRNAVEELVNNYRDEEISITITGHSLGAALATLNAADIVANGYNKPNNSDKACMVTAFVFASPKVGDKAFRNVFNGLGNLQLLNIRNICDIVTKVPLGCHYKKVGIQLKIKSSKSYGAALWKAELSALKIRPAWSFEKWKAKKWKAEICKVAKCKKWKAETYYAALRKIITGENIYLAFPMVFEFPRLPKSIQVWVQFHSMQQYLVGVAKHPKTHLA